MNQLTLTECSKRRLDETSLLQTLMQKHLDTELDNHLEYSKYTHIKDKNTMNIRNSYCKFKNVKTNMEI